MEITGYTESLRSDLSAVAESGDEQARAAAERLLRALEPSLRIRFLDALGEAAAELSGQLPEGRVELRLAGPEVTLAFVESTGATVAEEDYSARITLRLPDSLKARAEQAAAREGISMNTWVVRALARALEHRPRGHQLRGFARS